MPSKVLYASVLYSLAFGRWGAYVGTAQGIVSPTSILLVVGVALQVLSPRRLDRATHAGSAYLSVVASVAFGLYLVLMTLQAHAGHEYELRDDGPLLILMLAPAFARAVEDLGRSGVQRGLIFALGLHTAWALPAAFGAWGPLHLPTLQGQATVLDTRGDFDGALLGITGVLLIIWSFRRSRHALVSLSVGVLALAADSRLGSRSGLLAVLPAFVALYGAIGRERVGRTARMPPALVASVVLVPLLTLEPQLLQTRALEKLGVFGSGSSNAIAGADTANARYHAWSVLWSWVREHHDVLVGAGPGVDVVGLSGARQFLSGKADVRAPHNGYLGIAAHFGIVGLVLFFVSTAVALVLLRGAAAVPGDGDGDGDGEGRVGVGIARATVSGLALAALVGVIFESPFAMIPFVGLLPLAGIRLSGGGAQVPRDGARRARPQRRA